MSNETIRPNFAKVVEAPRPTEAVKPVEAPKTMDVYASASKPPETPAQISRPTGTPLELQKRTEAPNRVETAKAAETSTKRTERPWSTRGTPPERIKPLEAVRPERDARRAEAASRSSGLGAPGKEAPTRRMEGPKPIEAGGPTRDAKRAEATKSWNKQPETRRPDLRDAKLREVPGKKPASWETPVGYLKHGFEANVRPFEAQAVTKQDHLRDQRNSTTANLEKKIRSQEKHAQEHKDFVAEPNKHKEGFSSLPYGHRSRIMGGWKKEIKAAENQIKTLKEIVSGRTGEKRGK